MDTVGILRNRKLHAAISAAMIVALTTVNAQAITLANVEGAVSVNRGYGFKPASVGSALAPGDRVRVGDGSADIVYENGCATHILPQQVAVVLSAPPACGVGGLKDGVALAPESPSATPLILGGLVAGGAVGLAAALSNQKQSQVSP